MSVAWIRFDGSCIFFRAPDCTRLNPSPGELVLILPQRHTRPAATPPVRTSAFSLFLSYVPPSRFPWVDHARWLMWRAGDVFRVRSSVRSTQTSAQLLPLAQIPFVSSFLTLRIVVSRPTNTTCHLDHCAPYVAVKPFSRPSGPCSCFRIEQCGVSICILFVTGGGATELTGAGTLGWGLCTGHGHYVLGSTRAACTRGYCALLCVGETCAESSTWRALSCFARRLCAR
ncbi:hypothetical protein K438DRAFT_77435 [Mycena galopus ATCC 62051]|nr:hypothetical protein K438DRAFT_77435 [Mycena galopus ATCC 62051]